MKKLLRFLILLSFLFFGKNLAAQDVIKFGPSFMYNWESFAEKLYWNFGADVSYEFAIGKKTSIDVGAIFHYGDHKYTFNENVLQINYFVGGHTEIRRHFNEVFNGGYFGLGTDMQFWLATFDAPTPDEHPGNEGGLDINIGLSLGYLAPMDSENLNFKLKRDLYINPYFYLGFNPFGFNTFPIHARLGFNVGI